MKTEDAIVIQGRVLFALVMREMTTRFGRSAGGYLWAILEPAVTVALLVAVFSQMANTPPLGGSFALFFASGYMAFHIYRDISGNVSNTINANRPLLSFPRITLLDTIIARFALSLLTSIFVSVLVVGGLWIAAEDRAQLDFRAIFASVGMAAALGLSAGALNCMLFAYSQTWERFFNLINRPLFLISGVFFLYEDMPLYIRELLWWNPLVHVTALMRAGLYPMYSADFVSPVYVMTVTVLVMTAALLIMRGMRAKVLEG